MLFSRPCNFSIQVALIDPGQLRIINELLENETKGRGKVETLNFASLGEGEERLE